MNKLLSTAVRTTVPSFSRTAVPLQRAFQTRTFSWFPNKDKDVKNEPEVKEGEAKAPQEKEQVSQEKSEPKQQESPISPTEAELTAKLSECELKLKKTTDRLKEIEQKLIYERADSENQRKRLMQETENAGKFAISKFAKEILEIADNLERAVGSVKAADISDDDKNLKNLYDGVKMTDRVLHNVIGKFGISKIEALGNQFDPNVHEAVFQIPDKTKDNNTIAHETQSGYMIKDRCLRPSKVGVVKN